MSAEPQTRFRRMLVVDDDPDIRQMFHLYLASRGYDVSVASDGLEAIGAVESRAPEVVVLDLIMPRADGFAVLDRLSRSGPRVVCVTAKASIRDRERAWRLGADAYLTKPCTFLDVLAEAEGAVARRGPERHIHRLRALAALRGSRLTN